MKQNKTPFCYQKQVIFLFWRGWAWNAGEQPNPPTDQVCRVSHQAIFQRIEKTERK